MPILPTLRQSGGIESLSRKLGQKPPVTMLAVQAMLPLLLGAFRREFDAAGRGAAGVAHLRDLVNQYGGGDMAMAVMAPGPHDGASGQALIDAMMTPSLRVRLLAHVDAAAPGWSEEGLSLLLNLLAMLVGGYMGARLESDALASVDALPQVEAWLAIGAAANALDLLDNSPR
ncbi:hypothetical protein GTZ99_03890 [Novosphingobium sp. FSY-8]|uniref:TetR family transcriptional regulator n=1 Tax=Novosphingobium ovatum TaxID=1908523 RepID=A0ABW9XB06_9SPHN|nr:hypothetical protein [Novosphingobium ovatum]NBC35694.1 hypothetical protein [Novosphingobium ovatum]